MIRLYLLLAGAIAIGLGITILLFPTPFYAGYGIAVSGTDLLNELRSHGLFLALTGTFIVAGGLRPGLLQSSLQAATALYLSYGLSRLIAMVLDGLPGSGLAAVAGTELAIGLLGLVLLIMSRRTIA